MLAVVSIEFLATICIYILECHLAHKDEGFVVTCVCDFSLILLTFCLLEIHRWIKRYLAESKDYAGLEEGMQKIMVFNPETKFYALNVEDYNRFFDERLGFWYLCEQAKYIQLARKSNPGMDIVAKRIVVLDGGNNDSAELCQKAFGKFRDLTMAQINMKILFLLHQLYGIDLYIITRDIFDAYFKTQAPDTTAAKVTDKKGRLTKEIVDKYDRILINGTLYHPQKVGKKFLLKTDDGQDKVFKKNFVEGLFDSTSGRFPLAKYHITTGADGIIHPQFDN